MKDKINTEALENSNYEESKKQALLKYEALKNDLQSADLATKERAMKELPGAKNKLEQYNRQKSTSRTSLNAIQTKIQYLRSKLHIKKAQSINGFISYFTIN